MNANEWGCPNCDQLKDDLHTARARNRDVLLRIEDLKQRNAQLENLQKSSKLEIAKLKARLKKQGDYAQVVEERDALRQDLTVMFLTEQSLRENLEFESARLGALRVFNERLMKQVKAQKQEIANKEVIINNAAMVQVVLHDQLREALLNHH